MPPQKADSGLGLQAPKSSIRAVRTAVWCHKKGFFREKTKKEGFGSRRAAKRGTESEQTNTN